jgi:segregation and condensation protein B
MEKEKLKSIIESILFVQGEEITFSQLAKVIEVKKEDIINAVKELNLEYEKNKKGFCIIKNKENIQLATNPENAEFVEKSIKKNLQEVISRTALEVLAIVAYRGPVSRLDIEAIRGVNSSFTLRNLLMRGLIVKNANENDQRGYLYNISMEFIKKMGLGKIEEMPNYMELSEDKRVESIINLNVEK